MAKDVGRKVLILQIVCGFLALLCLGLLIALIVVSTRGKSETLENGSSSHVICPDNTRLKVQPARSSGLFNDLTKDEIIAVRDYILGQPSLNITPYEEAAINNNFIYLIELQQPPKDEALAFLDSDNDALKPERKARVVIFNGGKVNPNVTEYLVSPAAKPTKFEETTGPGHKYPIPFDSRPPGGKDGDFIEGIILNVTDQAFDLLKESFDGYTYSGCTDRCLVWSESAPGESGHRKKWIWFVRKLQGNYVHPVGFEIYLNTQGNDVSEWKVEKVFYYNQSFDSVEELMQVYKNGSLHKVFLPAPSSSSKTPLYSSYFQRGRPQPSVPLRPPQLVEPDGKRYTVSGSHVEYMKWSFDFRSRSSTGMQLFDIKFDGERIVYELSLQEAAAFYSGWSPMQMLTEYLDTAWGMGSSKFELVPGIDCPSTATFFDTIHFVSSSEPATFRKSVCLFELDLGLPLRRHFDNDFGGGYNFYGGMPGIALVLRSVSTAYNYDYIYDYMFYPNGVVEVRVSTSGYVQATYWTVNEAPYGTEIHTDVAGTIHDHLINYKVDMDIGGRENSFENIEIKVENITNPWFPGSRRIQKVLSRSLKQTEQEATYRQNFEHPKYLNFFSDGKVNKMGVNRGYRIHIRDMMKQMYPNDWELMSGAAWTQNQMTITKRKEEEERSSSIYNQNSMHDPVVDFSKFTDDDESIVNEDLVAWVTVGVMHIPHSEDIPNTATAANSASFFLRPYNYFDEDPSMASQDGILILPTENGADVNTFGTPDGPSCAIKNKPVKYTGNYGDV
ncbi:amiloride-sensitive amine oxidase [copper-containing]-like [Stylophora pistillata]|uniref:amiloride-sensitive amine oxidase [copper-containing]-like n=1 Tax=Stylophora pistillata TaxID=50429 RepID=UPI000C040278|nr:amiloride-sensitive amine oxidase [copper-containing]-like [Stylophora pistillata]